jgi:hypothetical protein
MEISGVAVSKTTGPRIAALTVLVEANQDGT